MNNYIIIANSHFLVKEIILEAIKNKIIVALDGAANRLAALDIKPHIILGDFDSINKAYKNYWGIQKTFADISDSEDPYQGHHGVLIIPAKNQKFTDLTKAIHYCDQQDAASISVICALGDRFDHHEGAVRSLRSEYKKERTILIYTDQQTLRFAKNETLMITGEVGENCGFVAFPEGSMSSQGLQYEADNYKLRFGFSENICNTLIKPQVTVSIQGEVLIIMPPQLSSQKWYMGKSEEERLALQLRDVKAFANFWVTQR